MGNLDFLHKPGNNQSINKQKSPDPKTVKNVAPIT